MTIASEITRIKTAIADAYTACQDMGATMPAILNSDNLEQCIASITGGGSSATVLHLYDRVDNKATVAGFWTDGNSQRYAVCVADAAYRSGSQLWSNYQHDILPNYTTSSAALAATESATFNMNTIRSNYDLNTYPAFNSAYSKTITLDGTTYNGLLPNAAELQMIYQDRATLDTYDTTLTDYPSNDLTTWNIEGNSLSACWSSIQYSSSRAWRLDSSGSWYSNIAKSGGHYGIIPIFEIPVDENGEVQ